MPRTQPAESTTFTRTCPVCGKEFTTDNARTKYDTPACKKVANNEAYYKKHAGALTRKNNDRQKDQRRRLNELESNSQNN